jgi:CheY-like chemotaxis protein
LLADDSITIQKVVDLTFSDEGLEVVTVGDGQQALEKLEEFTPDIVLADVFMPGLNGYQLCEHVKRDERLSHIPVMLLVGSFEPFDEAEARRVGADDYLTKPFQSIRTLISKVRNLLTGGGATEASEQPTRRLAPPPEAEKENRPDTGALERMTADTAPLPDAHAEEAEAHVGHAREVPFTDLSMDDEMIEATPASSFESAGPDVQNRATAQYSAADLREAGIMQSVETEQTREPVQEFAPARASEPAPAASAQQQQAPARFSSLSATDDMLLDLGDAEPAGATAEGDDFFLDLLDEAPPQASAQSFAGQSAPVYPDVFAPPAEAASTSVAEDAGEAATFEEASAEPQAQEFVEAQVIGEEAGAASSAPTDADAAPVTAPEPQAWQEASTASHFAPTERLPEDFQAEGAPGASPSAAAPPAGQITLEQLSPEVIDAIARRAVEHLSKQAVEQIAWEVVPQLAELLIKRRLEEEKQ